MSQASSSKAARPTKLKFKGEDKNARKKRKHDGDGEGGSSRRRRLKGGGDEDDADGETWVLPGKPEEIKGPVFIIHQDPSTHSSPLCISFDATRGKVVLHALGKKRVRDADAENDDQPPPDAVSLQTAVPTDVSQVWVATRPSGSSCVNLRTGAGGSGGAAAGLGGDTGGGGSGKFISCDTHGLVSCFREARGPQEEWTAEIIPDSNFEVAFRSPYDTYLSVDEAAGGVYQLRADATEIGTAERFVVKVQADVRRQVREEERERVEGKRAPAVSHGGKVIDEVGTNHEYQAWGAGRSVVSNDDKKTLKKALKEGRLSEALLDRRSKLKSDKFC